MSLASADKYHQTYWPKLAGALTLILNQTPGQFFPISYEEMYTYGNIGTGLCCSGARLIFHAGLCTSVSVRILVRFFIVSC